MRFNSIDEVATKLQEHGYYANEDVVSAVYVSLCINKPLLVDGPPGVGKTFLAKVLSEVFDAELIRLQCYEGIDSSKVIYDINYQKQMLYISLMKDTFGEKLKDLSFDEAKNYIETQTDFYGDDFLLERPLLKAINPKHENKKVLLIDEVDKTDYEIEAMMLETLSDYSVTIPEYGTVDCDENNKPIIVLTTNNQRELSEALKRRCCYLYIDYPSVNQEAKIIAAQGDVESNFSLQLAEFVNKVRKQPNLKKKPSISESIEWAKVLFHDFKVTNMNDDMQVIVESLSALMKNKNDVEKVMHLIGMDK